MKTNILDIQGKKKSEIGVNFFSSPVREYIVAKVLAAKRSWQPYAPSLTAGKKHSAKGKIVHRRHVWRSGYGRGQSRVPRKIFSQKGGQFNWEAAEVPHARGGMRAHPPKIKSMKNKKKVNKKELQIAFVSGLSATAKPKYILKKYKTLDEKDLGNIPVVVESKLVSLKTKEFLSSLKKILGGKLFELAIPKKKSGRGKGKLRGRKYKRNAGALLVIGSKEKVKSNLLETEKANTLGIQDLAKGGVGRLVIYTEDAIKEITERLKTK